MPRLIINADDFGITSGVNRAIVETWGERDPNDFVVKVFGQAVNGLKQRDAALDALKPSTDEQKALLSAAKQASAAISQARVQMALALVDPISYPLVGMVIPVADAATALPDLLFRPPSDVVCAVIRWQPEAAPQ